MTIAKKILKTYKTLYNYNKNNKFSQKKNRSFIHMYLLFLQNKYRFNFDFKNYPKSLTLHECVRDLYAGVDNKKLRNLLFPDDKLLGEIFFLKSDFDIEKYLRKLEEYTYNLNYVNTNIQIVDYLGNTENDVTVTKVGLCVLVFMKQFPLIKINSRLLRNVINHLCRTAKPIHGNLTYINSQSIMILQQMNKLHKFDGYEDYIKLVLLTQDTNGLWSSGFNSYIVQNSQELDILHTSIVMLNLLDYQTWKTAQELKNPLPSPSPSLDKKLDMVNKKTNTSPENSASQNIQENFENKLEKKLIKKKKNTQQKHKVTIERFDNLRGLKGNKFYFDLNFYNTTLILVCVLVLINLPRLQKIVPRV